MVPNPRRTQLITLLRQVHDEVPGLRATLREPCDRMADGHAWTGPVALQWRRDLEHHDHMIRVRLARLVEYLDAEIRAEPLEVPDPGAGGRTR